MSRSRTRPPGDRSAVLEAAFRRLERAGVPPLAPDLRPAAPRAPGRPREAPVLTLDAAPAARVRPRLDPAALAMLLAEDAARKMDELVYLWRVIRELEPFASPSEPPLARRAAELALVEAGGALELPIEALLRATRSFLDAHGMDEAYVRTLCAWYLADDAAARPT